MPRVDVCGHVFEVLDEAPLVLYSGAVAPVPELDASSKAALERWLLELSTALADGKRSVKQTVAVIREQGRLRLPRGVVTLPALARFGISPQQPLEGTGADPLRFVKVHRGSNKGGSGGANEGQRAKQRRLDEGDSDSDDRGVGMADSVARRNIAARKAVAEANEARTKGSNENTFGDSDALLLHLEHLAHHLDVDVDGLDALAAVCTAYCAVCFELLVPDGPLPTATSVGTLPTCCSKEFCLFRFEEMTAERCPLLNRSHDAAVLQFRLDVAEAALVYSRGGRLVFNPFPATFLAKQQVVAVNRGQIPQLDVVGKVQAVEQARDYVRLGAALTALQASQDKILAARSEQQLVQALDLDAYRLLRFLLIGNRVTLTPDYALRHPVADCIQRFNVQHPADVEERFRLQVELAGEPYLFFHGTPFANVYSILANGLRVTSGSQLQSTGMAYGVGIYLTRNINFARQYAQNMGAILVCEVAGMQVGAGVRSTVPNSAAHPSLARVQQSTSDIWVCPFSERVIVRQVILCDTIGIAVTPEMIPEHFFGALPSSPSTADSSSADAAADERDPEVDGTPTPPAPAPAAAAPGVLGRLGKLKSLATSVGTSLGLRGSGQGSLAAQTRSLMRALEESRQHLHVRGAQFHVEIVDDRLDRWRVLMFNFPPQTNLAKAMHPKRTGTGASTGGVRVPFVDVRLVFPQSFPIDPPFVYVKWPRFQQCTGHVTAGGSVCTPLLVAGHSWNPTFSMSMVILLLHETLVDGAGQIVLNSFSTYDEAGARDSFANAVRVHHWDAPQGRASSSG